MLRFTSRVPLFCGKVSLCTRRVLSVRQPSQQIYNTRLDIRSLAPAGHTKSVRHNHTSECEPPDRACLRIIKCWVCGHAREQVPQRFLDEITCEKCKTLQPPHPEYNYYDLFDKAPTFDVNVKNLQSQYRLSQNLLHPDKWSMSTPEQKRNAAQQSSLMNKAFRTLRDPLQRGLYLLKLRGMPIEEKTENNDPAFLMEIMDINEAIEDAETEADVAIVHDENRKKIEEVIEDVSDAFRQEDLKRAHTLMGKLQFYENINQLTTHWQPGQRQTITH